MTPEQTTALIALVTWYQRADAAFAADDSLANAAALAECLADLLDWREPTWDGIASVSDSHGNTWVMLVDGATTTGTCGTCAHFEKLGPSSRGLCRNSQSIAVDSHVTPDDGCRLGYTPKATS